MLRRSEAPAHENVAVKPAVFMDKDGTLIENVPYNVDVSLIRWMPGAEDALRLLSRAGFEIVVVSNQSGVAEGYFPESALVAVERKLREMAEDLGVELGGFFYCPHAASTPGCECRKPMPGLIHRAATQHDIHLPVSWFIGDILSDVEAGNRAGCRSILVGPEPVPDPCPPLSRPFAITSDLREAAQIILRDEEAKP